MGMGEPLANYDNLLQALRILNAPWGGGIWARARSPFPPAAWPRKSAAWPTSRSNSAWPFPCTARPMQIRAADSCPSTRNIHWRELTAACEYYQEKKGRMITLEYILIAGVNDALDQAPPLADWPGACGQGQPDSLQQSGRPALGAPRRSGPGGLLAALEKRKSPPPCAGKKAGRSTPPAANSASRPSGNWRLKRRRQKGEGGGSRWAGTLERATGMDHTKDRNRIVREPWFARNCGGSPASNRLYYRHLADA